MKIPNSVILIISALTIVAATTITIFLMYDTKDSFGELAQSVGNT